MIDQGCCWWWLGWGEAAFFISIAHDRLITAVAAAGSLPLRWHAVKQGQKKTKEGGRERLFFARFNLWAGDHLAGGESGGEIRLIARYPRRRRRGYWPAGRGGEENEKGGSFFCPCAENPFKNPHSSHALTTRTFFLCGGRRQTGNRGREKDNPFLPHLTFAHPRRAALKVGLFVRGGRKKAHSKFRFSIGTLAEEEEGKRGPLITKTRFSGSRE